METILLVAALLAVLVTVLLIIWALLIVWRCRLDRKRYEEIMRRIDAISRELAMDCLEDEG